MAAISTWDTSQNPSWGVDMTTGGVTGGITGMPQYPKLPTYTPPAYPALPEYKQIPFDIGRVNLLTQETAAPELARLRTATRQAIKQGQSPQAYREAIAGYGTGIANVMPSAQQKGLQQYTATEYNPAIEASRMNYQNQINRLMGDYQAAVNAGQVNQARQIQELLGQYQANFKTWEYAQKAKEVKAAKEAQKSQNLGINWTPINYQAPSKPTQAPTGNEPWRNWWEATGTQAGKNWWDQPGAGKNWWDQTPYSTGQDYRGG